MTLRVLHEAGGLIAVDKPAGLLVIPGRQGDAEPCARALLAEQLGRPVWVCHRIDRDTSGVVVFATDAAAHRAASLAFEHGAAKKRYLALVEGVLAAPVTIEVPLTEGRKGRVRPCHPGEQGRQATTVVRPLEAFARATLVECEPLTGRQHQIRVHLRAVGHPLLFDHQYGRKTPITAAELGGEGPEVLLARTPLHAAALALPGLGFEAQAPLPLDLARCLGVLRSAP